MFFSKKKTQVEARAKSCAEMLRKLENDIAEVEKLTDVGKRYLELTAVNSNVKEIKNSHISSKPAPNLLIPTAVGCLGGASVVFLLVMAAAPITAALAFPFIMIGGPLAMSVSDMQKQNRQKPDKDDLAFFISLDALSEKVSAKKDSLLRDHLLDFRLSPHFKEICTNFPDVASAFAQAAAKTSLDIPRIVQLDKSRIENRPL